MSIEANCGTGCPEQPSGPAGSSATDLSPFVRRTGGRSVLDLTVRGARCGACISKIEGGLFTLPGVETARLNLSNGRLRVEWRGGLSPLRVAQTMTGLGYDVSAFDPSDADASAAREERGLLTAMGVAGFAMANIMLLSVSVWAGAGEMGAGLRTLLHWISAAIAVPTVAFAGRPFFRSAWAVLRRGHTNMDVPISLAVILSVGFSVYETSRGGEHAYFDASVMLLFFLLIGRYLDARLRRRAHAAAHDLAALQGRTVRRFTADGALETVASSDISPGDSIALVSGERAVVDLKIASGAAEIDESLVTGESAPRRAQPGEIVYAGSVNLGQTLRGVAIAAADDSLVADIARMLEAGEQRRSTYRRIADIAVSLYVPIVHSVAALTFAGWLIAGAPLHDAVFIAISTLIITCPCALALAAPVVQVVASGRLFRRGVFLRSGDALERIATADHIVFDKTGTLTLGRPRLDTDDLPSDMLEVAARLARASRHPLSQAVAFAAGDGPIAHDIAEHPGLGLEGRIDGRRARLGSAAWTGAEQNDGAASLWLAIEDDGPIALRFEDQIREDARDSLNDLRRLGLTMEILSGDRAENVVAAAAALGVETFTAQATPVEKSARLEALRANGRKVLMIGDGLNDAGALALAHASLAPGGAMDVSQSASDAVYARGLDGVVQTIVSARSARKRLLENFGFAALYNLVAIPVAVAGLVTPLIAALAMSGSSILVTLNALRTSGGRS